MSKYQIPPALTTSITPFFSSLVFTLLFGGTAYFSEHPGSAYWPFWALCGLVVGLGVGMLSELNVIQKVGQYEGNLWQLAIIWGANRGVLLGGCFALFALFFDNLSFSRYPFLFTGLEELLSLLMSCAGVVAVAAWWAVSRRVNRPQFWDPGREKTIFFSMFWGIFTCSLINFGIQLDLQRWSFEPESLLLFLGLGAMVGAILGSLKPL